MKSKISLFPAGKIQARTAGLGERGDNISFISLTCNL